MAACKQSDNWQGERSLVECNRYMMEHDIADVTFKLEYKNKHRRAAAVHVRALKTLLLARSSVFHAMFCGELQEQSQVVTVTDVEPGAFKELIRYIYTDDVHLTADNVLAVLYASKKYMVSTLTIKCAEYLEKQLNADTALELLEQSIFFDVKDLMTKCIVKIQSEASKVLSSDGFVNLSQAGVHEILKGSIMNAPELDVFRACVKWAENQCKKKELPILASSVRAELGDDLFLIRFPAMSVTEFNKHVVPHELLTFQEGFKLLRHFTSEEPVDIVPFIAKPRGNPFIPHLLLMEGPFVPILCDVNVTKSTSLQCSLSGEIKLSKLLMHYVQIPTTSQVDASINITQGNQSVASTSLTLTDPTLVVTAEKCPQHVVFDIGNISIPKDDFRVNVSFYSYQKPGYGHYTQMQMHCTPPELTNLKDDYISIDFQPVAENVILGFEYSLVV